MERLGVDSRSDEALCGFVLKKHGQEVELLVHKAEPIEDHRLDRIAYGDNKRFWRVLYCPVKDIANTQFVKLPGHEPEMVQDPTRVGTVHRCLLA
jgi:hypothetical protein